MTETETSPLPLSLMKLADRKRFKKWEGWLLLTLTRAHQLGSICEKPPRSILDATQNVLYALHAGLEQMVEMDGNLVQAAPELPEVWPAGFPVNLAVGAFRHLESLKPST